MRSWLALVASLSIVCSPSVAVDREALSEAALPPVLVSPTSVGEVAFPHQMHFDDLGIDCGECHHEINAARLKMPHEDYFDDFWIDCLACHTESETPSVSQSCSSCHHSDPTGIADETLSSKVVIHKSCWTCHEIGTGAEASAGCASCHQSGEPGS